MRRAGANILSIMFIILFFSSFKKVQFIFIANDADAELVMADVKVRIIGLSEFTFTEATGNFYTHPSGMNYLVNQSIKEKLYNRDLYVNNKSTMFSLSDSTYKMVDSTFTTSLNDNFTWEFLDLTDTNTIIQYTTTKPITRVSQFNLSNVNSIDKSAGFSYSHPLIQADSIVYLLGTDSLTSIKKTVLNQSYGITYTPTELNNLQTSNEGAFIILIFKSMPQTYNGKKYYFQNNSSVMVLPLPIH